MEPANAARSKRVMIVEDEYFTALDIAQAVEAIGGAVVGPAADLAEAQRLLSAQPVDLVLLDINLSGVLSYSFADELVARAIPFVFMTGYQRSVIPGRFADVMHCAKPFKAEDLRGALSSL